ncbi:hypothetical protein [Corynebacterium guangdongense]|uniref:DUF2273 domain-containing protein n=1 Tax=Corynebacterium guangdongense TaxID=1783348 RepID=A0ABU1ZU90_9CORY|nr:hypothetical protein [Corynebacterium guangdongense]MDR7328500.1 hypothetical protein [Corynebacterium guangdongense]WJZ17077.1 hypothetical protein CGUA_02405 [Corynebacterium guangdongense]
MKNMTVIGVAVGLAFAFAVILGGLAGFAWALFFTLIGGVTGAQLEGLIDLRALLQNLTAGRGGRG